MLQGNTAMGLLTKNVTIQHLLKEVIIANPGVKKSQYSMILQLNFRSNDRLIRPRATTIKNCNKKDCNRARHNTKKKSCTVMISATDMQMRSMQSYLKRNFQYGTLCYKNFKSPSKQKPTTKVYEDYNPETQKGPYCKGCSDLLPIDFVSRVQKQLLVTALIISPLYQFLMK